MKQNKQNSKPRQLYDELFRTIKQGRLKAGDQLPAERQLANDFGISYMTARQAVQTLVDEGFLVKRPRVGTFVPFDIQERLSRPALNIIGIDSEAILPRQFARQVQVEADRLGYFGNMIAVSDANVNQAIRLLNHHQRPCVSLMNDYLTQEKFSQAFLNHPRLMLVGYNLSGMGVRSVLCDDAAAARTATGLLQEHGHRQIAFIGHNPSHPVMQQMIAGWQSSFVGQSAETLKKRLIVLKKNEEIGPRILRQIARNNWDATASVCASADIALAMVRAFRSIGLEVPRDHSLVTLGLAEDLPHYTPVITCVDPHLDEQVRYAVECTRDMMEGRSVDLLHLVMPHVIDGQTIATI